MRNDNEKKKIKMGNRKTYKTRIALGYGLDDQGFESR
jgi:hypothetical protein